MFEKIASARQTRPSRLHPRGVAVSVAAHVALVAGVASVPLARPAPELEEVVTHLWLPAPVDPGPTSPTAAPERAAADAAEDEDGTAPSRPIAKEPRSVGPPLRLADPSSTPAELPHAAPAVALAGVERTGDGGGGAAASSLMLALLPDTSRIRPRVEVVASEELAEPPRMLNRRSLARLLARDYPRRMEIRGIVGDVVVGFIIDADGWVEMESVHVLSATHPEFVEPTLRGLRRMRFTPAKVAGARVRVRTTMPVVWRLPG